MQATHDHRSQTTVGVFMLVHSHAWTGTDPTRALHKIDSSFHQTITVSTAARLPIVQTQNAYYAIKKIPRNK